MEDRTKGARRILYLILLGVALVLALFFLGNPFTRMLVHYRSSAYLGEQYGDLDMVKTKVGYDFIYGDFYVKAKSTTFEDVYFTLEYDGKGRFQRDSYQRDVAEGGNLFQRLTREYRAAIEPVFLELEEELLAKGATYVGIYGSIQTIERLALDPDYDTAVGGGIDGRRFAPLEGYDISEIGKAGGVIDVNIIAPSFDRDPRVVAEVLLRIKKEFDQAGIGVCFVHVSIGNEAERSTYRIHQFPYEAIYEEGLLERMAQARNRIMG